MYISLSLSIYIYIHTCTHTYTHMVAAGSHRVRWLSAGITHSGFESSRGSNRLHSDGFATSPPCGLRARLAVCFAQYECSLFYGSGLHVRLTLPISTCNKLGLGLGQTRKPKDPKAIPIWSSPKPQPMPGSSEAQRREPARDPRESNPPRHTPSP